MMHKVILAPVSLREIMMSKNKRPIVRRKKDSEKKKEDVKKESVDEDNDLEEQLNLIFVNNFRLIDDN